jgi:predicted PurR-regulated permease PerM
LYLCPYFVNIKPSMDNSLLKYLKQNHFLTTVLLLLVAYFIFLVRDVLLLVFISFVIMATLSPTVNLLQKRRVPRAIATLISYLVVLAILFSLIIPLVPFFAQQIQSLFNSFPRYLDQVASILNLPLSNSQINSFLGNEVTLISENAFSVTSKLFGGLFSTLTVFVVSFYMLVDKERIQRGIVSFFPKDWQNKANTTTTLIEEKLGAWFRGQLLLCFSIGLLTWLVLTLLGINFALPLAVVAGILEIIPTVGPIVSSIPAIIVALTISPTMAIIVALSYVVIQALENNLLVPKIMQKAVGLNPIVIILAIITGGRLIGIIGALLAIPFVSMLVILFRSFKASE